MACQTVEKYADSRQKRAIILERDLEKMTLKV